jgi:hypothetical protein
MFVQKLVIFGILIAIIIATLVSTLLITNFTRNAKSLPLSAMPATTAVAETLVNSTNSTNSTTGAHNPENLTFSPSTHPQSLAPQKKSLLEQAQNNRLHGPPLPSSGEPIRGPAPGTASP